MSQFSAIDLHCHTRHSDGTSSVARLAAEARAAGLDTVGLTDHDTTGGWAEAPAAARDAGVAIVPGMELSTRYDGHAVHLLSYLHDPSAPRLAAEIRHSVGSRRTRAREMTDRLARDYPITWDDVRAQAQDDSTLGRPHIADALVARGVVGDRAEAFSGLLSPRSPYYVNYYAVDTLTGIAAVREAGGVPVVAHPGGAHRGRPLVADDLDAMVEAGLLGIEADHREHTPQQREEYARYAAAHGLIRTGSSDYHGTGKPNRLGENRTDPAMLDRVLEAATSGVEVILP